MYTQINNIDQNNLGIHLQPTTYLPYVNINYFSHFPQVSEDIHFSWIFDITTKEINTSNDTLGKNGRIKKKVGISE